MRYLSYIVFCLFSFAMCTEQPKELLPELSYAESLMQRCPNSALVVLYSMEVPSPSDKFQYATWCLLITQARDKNYVKMCIRDSSFSLFICSPIKNSAASRTSDKVLTMYRYCLSYTSHHGYPHPGAQIRVFTAALGDASPPWVARYIDHRGKGPADAVGRRFDSRHTGTVFHQLRRCV